MPFARPSRATIRGMMTGFLTARLGIAVPTLRRWLLGTIGSSTADLLHLGFGYLDYAVRQAFASTADRPYLERQGRELGIAPTSAAPAGGAVVFAGTAGTPIAAGVGVQTTDSSVAYTTQASGTIGGGGTVSIAVLATTPGVVGNQPAGATLNLSIALAGVNGTATVDTGGLTGGLDVEGTPAYRARVLARKQSPPQGGCATDYLAWAKTVPGVTRAWVYPLLRGPGTVDVTFTMDGRADPLPLSGDIAAVQAAIGGTRAPTGPAPVTADALVWGATAQPVPVTIQHLNPSNSTTQAAVQTQLAALIASATPAGAIIGDGVSAGNAGGTLYLEQFSAAINGAVGVSSFDLVAPAADVIAATGCILQLGTVTFE